MKEMGCTDYVFVTLTISDWVRAEDSLAEAVVLYMQ